MAELQGIIPAFEIITSIRFDPMLITDDVDELPVMAQASVLSHFYMPLFHRDRMLEAARYFKWATAAQKLEGSEGLEYFLAQLLSDVIGSSGAPTQKPLKIRVFLSPDGKLRTEARDVSPVPQTNFFPERLLVPEPVRTFVPSPLTGGTMTVGSSDNLLGTESGSDPTPWHVRLDIAPTELSPFTTYKTTHRDVYFAARSRAGIENYSDEIEVLLYNPNDEIMEGSITTVYFFREGKWVTPLSSSGGHLATTRRWALENGLSQERVIKRQTLVEGETIYLSNGVRGFFQGRLKLQYATSADG